ncbi:hypothetical protein FB45DRAFT_1031801 [Roridomyces roridus]|uniref:Uncharacterized protein n=1 Tax=Roridomyces roridus TaxID=1738132 RepID=A0AAD7FG27_9AGAR|nr:hypothetical protein FB45DRAFT_1031801 [Roridomyces roridus]
MPNTRRIRLRAIIPNALVRIRRLFIRRSSRHASALPLPPGSAHSLLPQERWDRIIDLVPRRYLKSAALVSRVLVPRVQMTIFRSISVGESPWARQPLLDSPTNPSTVLVDILTRSSHLIHHVRELELWRTDEETITSLTTVPWSNLKSLTLFRSNAQLAMEWSREQDQKDLLLATPLISLPSLEALPRFEMGGAVGPVRAQHKLSITHLELCLSLPDLIVGYRTSELLDFSRLTHLKLRITFFGMQLFSFLSDFPKTVQHLEIHLTDDDVGRCTTLKLNCLPKLAHLTVCGQAQALPAFHEAFERYTPLGLHTITYLGFDPSSIVDLLPKLESSILADNLPELHSVALQVTLTDNGCTNRERREREAKWRSQMEQKMPVLVKRGLLVLEFEAED